MLLLQAFEGGAEPMGQNLQQLLLMLNELVITAEVAAVDGCPSILALASAGPANLCGLLLGAHILMEELLLRCMPTGVGLLVHLHVLDGKCVEQCLGVLTVAVDIF